MSIRMNLTFRLIIIITLSCILLSCSQEPEAMDLGGVWRIETNAVHVVAPFFGVIDDEIQYSDDFNRPYLEVTDGNVYYYMNDRCGTSFEAINYIANIDGTEGQIDNFYFPEDDTLITEATLYTRDSKLLLEYDFSVPWGELSGVIIATYYEGPMPPSVWSTTLEADSFEPDSLYRPGTTLGSPIALWIKNQDWENWKADRMSHEMPHEPVPEVTLPRPGHADLAGVQKFGFKDIRNVLERSSARETAMRVALGAICRAFLRELGIEIASHVIQIGPIKSTFSPEMANPELNAEGDASQVRCLDEATGKKMIDHIDVTRRAGDSIGGVFEVLASGLPAGLGSYTHWDRKLDARLAAAMMSINAMKAVSFGDGLNVADASGSQVHDEIVLEGENIRRATNHAGGIEGGMSNGELIRAQVTMKPIPTLARPLRSVDIKTREPGIAHKERTDACAVPAASVIGEAMMALVLTDAILEKFGGDSLDQVKAHMKATGVTS